MSFAFPSLEEILAEHLPEDKLDKVMRILYGRPAQRLEVTEDMREMGRVKDFDLQKWSISALPEKEPRPPRKVSIALVQNRVVLPTEAPILEQVLWRSRITSTDLITFENLNRVEPAWLWFIFYSWGTNEKRDWDRSKLYPFMNGCLVCLEELWNNTHTSDNQ